MRRFIAALFGISIIQTAYRGGQAVLGQESNYFYDAEAVWMPVAQNVLDGATLYGPHAMDNKPWLFQYINIAAMASGGYPLVMFGIVAVTNALSAYFLYCWLHRESDLEKRVCITAAFLFLLALPLIAGTVINVRSPALALFFVALLSRSPLVTGIAFAASGLFTQYMVFGAPLFLLQWRRDGTLLRSLPTATAAGVVTIAVSLLPLYFVWGGDAIWNAVDATIVGAGEYVGSSASGPLGSHLQYVSGVGKSVVRVGFVLVPAVAAIVNLINVDEWREWPNNFLLAGVVLFGLPILIKDHPYYWMLPMPWLATFAAVGVNGYLRS